MPKEKKNTALGNGACGKVRVGYNMTTKKFIAVKKSHTSYKTNTIVSKMLKNEFNIIKKLGMDVDMVESVNKKGAPRSYLFMPLMQTDFFTYISKQNTPYTKENALRIFKMCTIVTQKYAF